VIFREFNTSRASVLINIDPLYNPCVTIADRDQLAFVFSDMQCTIIALQSNSSITFQLTGNAHSVSCQTPFQELGNYNGQLVTLPTPYGSAACVSSILVKLSHNNVSTVLSSGVVDTRTQKILSVTPNFPQNASVVVQDYATGQLDRFSIPQSDIDSAAGIFTATTSAASNSTSSGTVATSFTTATESSAASSVSIHSALVQGVAWIITVYCWTLPWI